jgi:hypothetical protein
MCGIEEQRWEALSEAERARIMDGYGTLMQELKASGRLLGGAKLSPSAGAVTVRLQGGKTVVTDGPFAETREQLGGYHLIECQDRDEAIAIAQRIPALSAGGFIEVRAVEFLE